MSDDLIQGQTMTTATRISTGDAVKSICSSKVCQIVFNVELLMI